MPRTIFKGRVRKQLVRGPRPRGPMAAGRMRLYRRPRYNATPTFTETVKVQTLTSNQSGVVPGILSVSVNNIIQFAQYAALYNQYCVRSVQFMVMPEYDNYDSTNLVANPASISAPRIVYAINDSAQQPAPTNELDVLTDNGCKIRLLDRPIRIRCRPVAQVGMAASTGGFVSESKKNRWLSTANPEIPHTGVSYCVTQYVPSALTEFPPPLCTIYAKITFSLRDPK